jgi:L-ribulokinase
VQALAMDTTGSSVIPVDKNLQPLDEYYLWCDHHGVTEGRARQLLVFVNCSKRLQ